MGGQPVSHGFRMAALTSDQAIDASMSDHVRTDNVRTRRARAALAASGDNLYSARSSLGGALLCHIYARYEALYTNGQSPRQAGS